MSLDRWYSAEKHDVKTFNSIFNLSKIKSNPDNEVKIGNIRTGEIREVMVNGEVFLMTLNYDNLRKKWEYKEPEPKVRADATKDVKLEINNPTDVGDFYKLKPAEFKVYAFIKEFKLISNSEVIVQKTNLSLKTVRTAIPKLEKLGYIKTFRYGRGLAIQFIGNE